ncbi:hypothetical protein AUC43_05945 [Hymenobacter sedentarius]|uniref:DUF5683 domain-containing protein n=1 Tax=Hymenobacter sedentarius TaxID=1411621 RepID=A0A0U3SEU6_9BACT|nr:hypothetical protein [Hymenobacter sedentarius]ALW84662.1 hypothetical protein AUC43_05945 [Hymenobacter sedentarius]
MHEINRLAALPWRLRGVATVALSISLLGTAQAQKAPATIRLPPQDAERGLNGPQHNFDFLPPGETGNHYQSAGFFGQKLRPYLAGNPEALAHLDDYRRQKTIFLIDRLVAIGAFGLYGQQIFAHGEAVYFNDTQKAAIGVFATSVLATVLINRNTNTHLLRAVTAYNAGVAHIRGWQRLQPTTVGLGTAPTGHPLLALRWALR